MSKRRSSPGSASSRYVTRAEFDRLSAVVEDCLRQLTLQFKRIAQIQAELDHTKTVSTPTDRRTDKQLPQVERRSGKDRRLKTRVDRRALRRP